jgi:cytochrome c-type biogenesis protein CcsB
MESALFYIALAGYAAASAGALGFLSARSAVWHKAGHGFFLGALAAQTLHIALAFIRLGHFPASGLRSVLCVAIFTTALVHALFYWRYRVKVLGGFIYPVLFLGMSLAAFASDAPPETPGLLSSPWLIVHVLTVFLGDGAFLLAAFTGAAYLWQEHAIKTKHHGYFFKRLPSLDILDRMGYALVAFGFPMLTIGLATGCVYAQMRWGLFWQWHPKEVWSLVTWLVYAALLHERLAAGWRGRKTAIMAIAGLLALLFTFFGVNLLYSGHHAPFTRL